MNILPKSHTEFANQNYWDSFFVKRQNKSFEWYGEYNELSACLRKYIRPCDNILNVGCGNSNLAIDMYLDGYTRITSIDVSNVVIKQMIKKCKKMPELLFKKMDVKQLQFGDGSFTVVLDKGTLDALMPNDSKDTISSVEKMFQEIDRVLRIGGRYICISLLQRHILNFIMDYFTALNWMIRITKNLVEDNLNHNFPVFTVTCTKLKKMFYSPIHELDLVGKRQRFDSKEKMIESITSAQQAALMLTGLGTRNISETGEFILELQDPDHHVPRFTIVITDAKCDKSPESMSYAAFVVPQGREREWLFGTPEGRGDIREKSGMDRLAFILLHRKHKYEDLEQIQKETRDAVRSMAPANIIDNKEKILYLSVGNDTVGDREEVFKGTSEFSGDFIIEDARGDDGIYFRRLIFLETQNCVQSEAKMIEDPTDPSKKIIDLSYASCDHHVYMTIGVCMANTIQQNTPINILIIGLGGGGLAMFIRRLFPEMYLTVVDIDPEVKKIAVKYFDLKEDDHLKVVISDGIEYIKNSDEKFSAVLVDVDSKDPSKGLSCPPEIFLKPEFFSNVKNRLNDKGIFILNLVCRLKNDRDEVWSSLRELYNDVHSIKLKEEVNEIIYSHVQKSDLTIETATPSYNKILAAQNLNNENIVELSSLFDMIRLN